MFELDDKNIRVYRVRYRYDSFSHNFYASPTFKLCLVCNGNAIWQIGSKCLSVKKGDVVILNNRQQRMFRHVSEVEGIEMLIIEFESQMLVSHFQELLFNQDEKNEYVISGSSEMNRLFQEIEQEDDRKLNNYQLIIRAKLVELLSQAGRSCNMNAFEQLKMSEEMYRALTYINENYRAEISLKRVAEVLHMSESSFSKYFSKYMKVGFAQYIMQRRINDAIHLLQSSEKTVLEIALDCGYNNTACFYKAFKKITHTTPKDYRNMKDNYYI